MVTSNTTEQCKNEMFILAGVFRGNFARVRTTSIRHDKETNGNRSIATIRKDSYSTVARVPFFTNIFYINVTSLLRGRITVANARARAPKTSRVHTNRSVTFALEQKPLSGIIILNILHFCSIVFTHQIAFKKRYDARAVDPNGTISVLIYCFHRLPLPSSYHIIGVYKL